MDWNILKLCAIGDLRGDKSLGFYSVPPRNPQRSEIPFISAKPSVLNIAPLQSQVEITEEISGKLPEGGYMILTASRCMPIMVRT